jgi:hypothetical protein
VSEPLSVRIDLLDNLTPALASGYANSAAPGAFATGSSEQQVCPRCPKAEASSEYERHHGAMPPSAEVGGEGPVKR